MGAQQSVAEGIIKSKNFTILGYKENDIYGSFKIVESQGNLYAMVSKTCQNQEDYANLCKILKETQQYNSINQLVKLVEVDTQEESNLCSTFYKVSALYEYYDITLREITKQASVNCLFVLKSLSEGLRELYTQNQVHGNLTPDFVLIDKSKGEVKFNNCTQLTGYNHYKRILASDGLWYLSPELVTALGKKDLRPQYNHEKSEVYQLGLIALELWGNGNVQSFYDKQTYSLNQSVINEAIDEFGVRNGYVLKNVIKQMLQLDPNARPNMTELSTSFAQLYDIQLQITEDEPKTPLNVQSVTQQQVVTLCELNQEEQHQDFVQIHKESFQFQELSNSNEVGKQNFEESPKKVEKQHVEVNPQSVKSSVSQSIKEYYVTGSIAAQFGQLALLESNPEYQSNGTAQFENHHDYDQDVLQEKPQNIQPNSTKSHESTVIKKSVKVNSNPPPNKKPISIKRPKHESIETKLPKQAVVVNKRR
ncbi:unnamed protein product (macronuclear) [Paramecium tetraurelia]|uniref:Protein kinase domain-containing protein n=1 Tax=Paramecium tetraurelia TaxID=5888 RepID=A0DDD7_PARTE|nr:uncharacterized protein GSPATT00015913001 [Paramecium tetraurelia]CAK81054.1 unnamed protein product [Paramecium tetraurelia]|eukprot:XP_001448451.1 hypothetical protein (macronuclear) [Paramecium tetraurelia strain d4-2]